MEPATNTDKLIIELSMLQAKALRGWLNRMDLAADIDPAVRQALTDILTVAIDGAPAVPDRPLVVAPAVFGRKTRGMKSHGRIIYDYMWHEKNIGGTVEHTFSTLSPHVGLSEEECHRRLPDLEKRGLVKKLDMPGDKSRWALTGKLWEDAPQLSIDDSGEGVETDG